CSQYYYWFISLRLLLLIFICRIRSCHQPPQSLLLTANRSLRIHCFLQTLHLHHPDRITLQVHPPARIHRSTTIRRDNNQSIPITDVEQRCCTFPAGLSSSSSQQ